VDPFLVAFIGFLCFLLLAVFEVPLGFAFITVGFVVRSSSGAWPGLNLLGSSLYSLTSSYTFRSDTPVYSDGEFRFYFRNRTRSIYMRFTSGLEKLPGGIALATMVACAGFGTCSGSTVAAAATMGTLCFPEMVKLRYNKGFSAAVIAAGGTLDIIIPPVTLSSFTDFITDVSIAALFAAGFLPGVLLCLVFMLLILAMCQISQGWARRVASLSLGKRELPHWVAFGEWWYFSAW